MKFVSLIFAFLLASNSVCSAQIAASIVGTHRLEMGEPGNSFEIVLECKEESRCTFTTTSISDGRTAKDAKVLNEVRPVENLMYAINALKYAIDHQAQAPRFPDAIEAMKQLRPVLSTNPGVSRCWDLNHLGPEYMLACTLSNTPANSPPIYLFATLMADCNDAFCRYLIIPMSRAKPR